MKTPSGPQPPCSNTGEGSAFLRGNKKYWIGIGVSIILLAYFLFTVEIGRMLDALAGANYWYIFPAVAMYFISVYFRSMRWSVMLRHLKPVSTRRLFPVVVVGYMANNILPMRLGEIVRSYYLSEREGVSATSALVTVFVERIFDALALLFFIALIVPFVPVAGLVEDFGDRWGLPPSLLMLGLTLPFIGAFCVLVLLSAYPDQTRSLALRLLGRFPERLTSVLDGLLTRALDGIAPLRSPRTLAALFGLSIPIWLTEVAVFWLMGYSFGIEAYHDGAVPMAVNMVLTTAITNLGGSIPAAPGGLGLFELIAREILVLGPLASVDRSVAGGYVIALHAVILLPVIILGQIILWTSHLSLRRLSQ